MQEISLSKNKTAFDAELVSAHKRYDSDIICYLESNFADCGKALERRVRLTIHICITQV